MTIEIKHPFVSAKGDGGDATMVRPSNWNAAHSTSMATGNLLGRLTVGVGAFEEIPISAFMAAALDETSGAAFLAALGVGGFETGDVKFSISPTAATGWVAYNGEGSISKAGSGGTVRANADTQPLYELCYNTITDAYCPVSGGRTGNAVNDFNAGKTLTLPRFSGRTIIGAGLGSGLNVKVIGNYAGAETHQLSIAELPAHAHSNSLNQSAHTHSISGGRAVAGDFNNGGGGGGAFSAMSSSGIAADANSIPISITNANAGSGNSHNNMQPYVVMWAKVKL